MVSGILTKLGRQGWVPAGSAVGDVVEPRGVGLWLAIPTIEFMHR